MEKSRKESYERDFQKLMELETKMESFPGFFPGILWLNSHKYESCVPSILAWIYGEEHFCEFKATFSIDNEVECVKIEFCNEGISDITEYLQHQLVTKIQEEGLFTSIGIDITPENLSEWEMDFNSWEEGFKLMEIWLQVRKEFMEKIQETFGCDFKEWEKRMAVFSVNSREEYADCYANNWEYYSEYYEEQMAN
ncbi:MAG: hypothetical protein LBO09_04475 [Candidatus Peribacteria bacterium]|jgi:hypothetical protein|nr:hypothetical protein [Candidatus Peribacteria bacterium]